MSLIKETEDFLVMEFTNEAGNKFEVGYPKSAGYTKESLESEIAQATKAKLEDGEWNVLKWEPNGDSYTSRAAINIGITGGFVVYESGIIYDYTINFANYKGSGFTFKDLTNDTYYCSTPRNGNHYINYNSSNAVIVGVR